jgi:hypothetical protein
MCRLTPGVRLALQRWTTAALLQRNAADGDAFGVISDSAEAAAA